MNQFEVHYSPNGETIAGYDTEFGTVRVGYNSDGALIHFETDGGQVVDYVIDGLGRRVGRKVNGVLTQGYLYDSQNRVVAIANGQGVLQRAFTYTSQAHMFEQINIFNGNTQEVITDIRGTPVLTLNQNGVVQAFSQMSAYGQALNDTVPIGSFGFAGCLWDDLTQVCHFGARDYSPGLGRWLQRDPIGFADAGATLPTPQIRIRDMSPFGTGVLPLAGTPLVADLNTYGYSLQDPVNYIDPSGKTPWLAIFGGVLLLQKGINITTDYLFCRQQVGAYLGAIEQSRNSPLNADLATFAAHREYEQKVLIPQAARVGLHCGGRAQVDALSVSVPNYIQK